MLDIAKAALFDRGAVVLLAWRISTLGSRVDAVASGFGSRWSGGYCRERRSRRRRGHRGAWWVSRRMGGGRRRAGLKSVCRAVTPAIFADTKMRSLWKFN